MTFLFSIFLSFFLTGGAVAENQTAVSIEVKPGKVYINRSDAGQHLNFDFILRNLLGEKLIINKVELTVFDAAGKAEWRDFYDEYGRKSLELAATPAIEKQSAAMFYNSFHTLPAALSLKRLRYEFYFSSEDRKRNFKSEIEVKPEIYETKTDLILPLRGRVLVWDGFDYNSHHRRVDYTQKFFREVGQQTNFQRYAYDFVTVDEQGLNYTGKPRLNDEWYFAKPDVMEEYFSYGEPVYAAGAGRVVAVRDDKGERQFHPRELAEDERAFYGNYVVIDHLNGEFSLFAHIKKGSALVKIGQMVKQGDAIAAVGAAGSSLFPHLHYELRDGAGAKTVEGLPSYFSNFRRLYGARPVAVKKGAVNTGEIIETTAKVKK
jgi:murein DD-endopeptidase MepM/ murein hydrolase activator NlpD